MMRTTRIWCVAALAAGWLSGCDEGRKTEGPAAPAAAAKAEVKTPPVAPKAVFDRTLLAAFRATEATPQQDPPEKIALGRMLYFETRLSKNHDLSCNSCHDLATWGVDNKPVSPGHKGQLGARNSPTVYDAAGHVAQFWDGRAKDLAEQAQGPVLNPVEMAMPDENRVIATLSSIPEYQKRFAEVFSGEKKPITLANAAEAIAAFERTLVTTSRFDRFVAGEEAALNEQEVRGLQAFVASGCTACHAGANLGGHMFQKVGLVKAWPVPEGKTPDFGRFDVTKNEVDKFMFKVSPLKNVAKTAPYFHDGSVADLKEAVKLMASHQLGRELSDADATDITVFLEALTGELPAAEVIAAPELPPSTSKTPKPDPT